MVSIVVSRMDKKKEHDQYNISYGPGGICRLCIHGESIPSRTVPHAVVRRIGEATPLAAGPRSRENGCVVVGVLC